MGGDPERDDAVVEAGPALEPAAALAGAVAHDLGNLLTVVMGNAELLMEGLADRPELAEFAGLILGAAQRATELTGRLDRFARPLRGVPGPTDPGPVLDDFARRLAYSLPPEIRLELALEPDLPPVPVPAAALLAALDELVSNALAALGGKGLLRIAAAKGTGPDGAARLLVSVADDGGGMEAETLRRTRAVRFAAGVAGHRTAVGVALALRVALSGQGALRISSTQLEGTSATLEFPTIS